MFKYVFAFVVGFLTVLVLGCGSSTVGRGGNKATSYTKQEFRQKVAQFEPHPKAYLKSKYDPRRAAEPHRTVANLNYDDFVEAFGPPLKSQTISRNRYYYWQCQDGIVQVMTALITSDEKTGLVGLCGINDD